MSGPDDTPEEPLRAGSERSTAQRPLLEVEGLRKYYFEQDTLTDRLLRRDPVSIKAVDGVSFHVDEGETLGLVGESGCGKSTTGETILQLRTATDGRISFDGENLLAMSDAELRAFRERAQVVFQDPFSSLDPRMTAGEVIAEPLVVHDRPASDPTVSTLAVVDRDGVAAGQVTVTVADDIDRVVEPVDAATVNADHSDGQVAVAHVSVRSADDTATETSKPGVAFVRTDDGRQLRISVAEDLRLRTNGTDDGVEVEVIVGRSDRALRRERAKDLLDRVGLAADQVDRYPHEFSGGQRQRIGIARALALDPEFIVLDEPVSALDVSVQAQVLNLLGDLQTEFGLTYLFIAHDLSVVRHISDRVAVMYLGRIVETGDVDDIFETPQHPYTEALLESVPRASTDEHGQRADTLRGDVPSPRDPPSGCRFHTRCPYAREACQTEEPAAVDVGDGQQVACFRSVEDHPYWDSEPLAHAVDDEES